MRKLSNTIYGATDNTFTCEGLPANCTVITPDKEFKVRDGIITETEFKPVTYLLELYENIKHTLMDAKKKVFDFYECDEVVYYNTYPMHDDIVVNLNDYSFRFKHNNKALLNLDDLGVMSNEALAVLDSILREGVFKTTFEILNEEGGDFETIGNITVDKTNELIDEIKDHLYALDDEANVFVSRFDDYSEGIPLKHLTEEHNGNRRYILKKKTMLTDILDCCKEDSESVHMLNMLFEIMKGLPDDVENIVYDNIVIKRQNSNISITTVKELHSDFKINVTDKIREQYMLFDNYYINIRYVINILFKNVSYESVLQMYVKYKTLFK